MSSRRPGDPYEVGFARPPAKTRFQKGKSGNPRGRPRKPPDPYSELMAVLQEKVTVTIDGEPQMVTIQQALLMRLRDQALRGRVWAEKLVLRVLELVPEEHDPLEYQLQRYESNLRLQPLFALVLTPEEIAEREQG